MAPETDTHPTSRYAARMEDCERKIGYEFEDKKLLEAALTHASGAATRLTSNERLEFLGDAILGMVVCEKIFLEYPDYLEGELTRIKSIVVSRRTCARISERLELQDCLILGKGMTTHPTVPSSVLADVFESLIAGIYLDGGRDAAAEFIERHVSDEIDSAVERSIGENYKSSLQQIAQREFNTTPSYRLLDEKGPDHSKCFKIAANVANRNFQPAWGRNKKEAEQRAARNAINQLQGEEPAFAAD